MPFETFWEPNGVYQRFSGRLTNRDKVRANHAVVGDRRFDAIKYRIIDSLAIEEYLPERSDATEAAAHDSGAAFTNANVLMVFVATNTDHRNNILHYMNCLNDLETPWKARLFDDLESARQWISETLK